MRAKLLNTHLLAGFLTLLATTFAHAHLAIVRQGEESVDVPEDNEHFGSTLIAGDFDGDGIDELVVGSPDQNVNFSGGSASQGMVTINVGTDLGLTHINAQMLTAADPLDDDIRFGASFAVGDFNNDDVDDLAIGAPHADVLGVVNAGQVFVHHGVDGNGLSLAPAIVLSESDGGGFSSFEGQFGFAMAAGDFDGDDFDDLAVTALHPVTQASWVFIFKGTAVGITANFAFPLTESNLGLGNGIGNRFGYSLATGNFRSTDEIDLAIGTPFMEVDLQSEAGAVIVMKGDPLAVLDTPNTLQSSAPQAGEHLGWSLAVGRFWDDNAYDDLAAGAPHNDDDPWTDSGRVLVKQYNSGGSATIVLRQEDGVLNTGADDALFGYSLAAGDILDVINGLWVVDGLDDLAIGAPGRFASFEEVNIAGAGTVDFFWGRVAGPNPAGSINRNARDLNDLWFDTDENLASALCFGAFDATGTANLAIGVPNKDIPAFIKIETDIAQAGQVNIFAPWRQPSGRPHRSSLVYDCGDRIIYSQRFRQRLTPASTTKALTAFLACEAIDSQQVDPDQEYTIPDWVANEVNGGTLGLEENEQMSFMDLLRCVILKSGNDCSYEIAHILTGEDNVWQEGAIFDVNMVTVVADFAAMMDARATQLGASSRTDFSNPAGRPYGEHWVTAEDMAIISREIMENEHLRDLVSLPETVLQRDTPDDGPFLHYLSNGWLSGLQGQLAASNGIKGGSNSVSLKTGLGAAELNNGRVIAAWFGVPSGFGSNSGLGGDLMKLVAVDCNPVNLTPMELDPLPSGFDEKTTQTGVPSDDGESSCMTANFNDSSLENRVVYLGRRAVTTPSTNLDLRVSRTLEFTLLGGETREISVDPMMFHDGYTVQNASDTGSVDLEIVQSHPSQTHVVILAPGERISLPDFGAGKNPSKMKISLMITNVTLGGTATLNVEELGYHTSVTLGDGTAVPATFNVGLFADGTYSIEQVEACLAGRDLVGGNTVDMSIHGQGFSTSVPSGPPALPQSAVHNLNSYPNPFNPSTTLSFELAQPRDIELSIFDVKGRRVRVLRARQKLSPGRHEIQWDGRDDAGRAVASGAYWFTVDGGERRWAKSVLLVK